MPNISQEVALEERSSAIGVENLSEIIEKSDSPEQVIEELVAANESVPEYLDQVERLTDAASTLLGNIAKRTNSEQAQNLVEQYNKEIKGVVSQAVKGAIGDKLDENLSQATSVTEKVLDKGLELLGIPHKEDNKEQEEMRKIILFVIAMVAMLFLRNFGLSPDTIAMAGMALKYMEDNKDKSKFDMVKDLAAKISTDDKFREAITEKAISAIETVSPQAASLGLREKAAEAEAVLQDPELRTMLIKTKSMIKSLSEIEKPAELVEKEFYTGVNTIIERSLEDNPELKEKLTNVLNSVKERNKEKFIALSAQVVKDGVESRNTLGKIQSLLSSMSSITEVIDNFKKTANEELSLTTQEKLLLNKVEKEAKSYVFERYGRPVNDFIEAANTPKTAEIASRLGLSRNILPTIASSISRICGQQANSLSI